MPNKCIVFGCNKPNGFRFPKDIQTRKRWIIAVKRDKWIPTANSVVCEDHFLPTDFVDGPTAAGALLRRRRNLKADAVPSVFFWTKTKVESEHTSKRKQRLERRKENAKVPPILQPGIEVVDLENVLEDVDGCQDVAMEIEVCTANDQMVEDSSFGQGPTDSSDQVCSATQTNSIDTASIEVQATLDPPPFLSIERLRFDIPLLHYYTGLETLEKFLAVFQSLGPAVYHLHYLRTEKVYNLSPENQFLLMLAKLRQGMNYLPLSRMAGVSVFTAENVFLTWINFCSRQWGEVDTWVSPEMVHFFAPSDFKRKFPTTRVILDGTEIPIEKPSNPTAQRASFSSYKNTNTVKTVVGATPGGLISFMSSTYGGSASDRQIMERSNLPAQCHPGDSVMADKGFNVQDLFAPHDVEVNIPAFFSKKNRLTERQVLDDRKVSSKRVHIERLIRMGKTYKILAGPLTGCETKVAHHILSVCFALCNFKNNIVSKDA